MKTTETRRLLEKYYNGESSIEEELRLKRFFETDDVPEEFSAEKVIFRYYSDNHEVPEPSTGFEQRIISALDNSRELSLNRFLKSPLFIYSGVAAGLLILFGSYFFLIHRNEPKDTFSNPEIAYNETVKILLDVSAKINNGTKRLDKVIRLEEVTNNSFSAINRSTLVIEKNMKKLDYFQQALEMANSPVDYIINK